ncbi:Crp/Fnr family transcriptional regulator [Sphingobium chlorophenolicum]|uniref:Cyclic nucleotide-binding domain protein n=1 Tax=Sphingobium chlorophenolicum TaxID=46429 RepID=A0A081R9B4_SPHCR|nr:helix-turn-helix domain-containing protein [Sphingobium chlorophenolicum]KEQ51787.1 Cyclic nucleotide-binding domain protein [Sphingobium chlorophenolicum]
MTLVALTSVSLRIAPAPSASSRLGAAYAHGRALNEAYLFGQIARLGRMNAHERLEDLCLELFDWLDLAGLTEKNAFAMPITQEMVADTLGMTPVHVNRMVQQARQMKTLSWGGGILTLHDADAMRRRVGRPRISPPYMA